MLNWENSTKVYIIYLIRRYLLPRKIYLLTAELLDFASNSVTLSAMANPGYLSGNPYKLEPLS